MIGSGNIRVALPQPGLTALQVYGTLKRYRLQANGRAELEATTYYYTRKQRQQIMEEWNSHTRQPYLIVISPNHYETNSPTTIWRIR